MRWALALQVYDFSISHCSGASHQNADGLSRQEWDSTDTDNPSGEPAVGKGGGDVGSASNIFSLTWWNCVWVTENNVEHSV